MKTTDKSQNIKDCIMDLGALENRVMSVIYNTLEYMGYDRNGNGIINPKKSVTHNQINYCFRMVHKYIFKPDKKLISNKQSIIDYSDIEQLQEIANIFLNICGLYNKSFGLMSFSFFTGIDYKTIYNWLTPEGEKINPERFQVLKYIQEAHKAQQIGLLNDSPVGALAVANNDVETGLEWSTKQLTLATNNPVFLIPSERLERLKLTAPTDRQERQPLE